MPSFLEDIHILIFILNTVTTLQTFDQYAEVFSLFECFN